MANNVNLALDAMGGDKAPKIVIDGADKILQSRPDIHFHIFGNKNIVQAMVEQTSLLSVSSTLHHCELEVNMDAPPSQALRQGRKGSSMWLAIESVKKGESAGAVSAGNTGALMAMSKVNLKTLVNIARPAIAAIWPTLKGESIVLDVGATIGADAQQLIDFSILGAAMAHALLDKNKPTVGLLNIGVEEVKGLEEIRAAGRILREANLPFLEYVGFVEGNDVGTGKVDVVVTEGFTGNVALKIAEGTAKQISGYIRSSMEMSLITKAGYLLAKRAFDGLKEKIDPRKLNGGVFLGLNGIVIKSHGGTDSEGFASAIEMAYDMVKNNLIEEITQDVVHYHDIEIKSETNLEKVRSD